MLGVGPAALYQGLAGELRAAGAAGGYRRGAAAWRGEGRRLYVAGHPRLRLCWMWISVHAAILPPGGRCVKQLMPTDLMGLVNASRQNCQESFTGRCASAPG